MLTVKIINQKCHAMPSLCPLDQSFIMLTKIAFNHKFLTINLQLLQCPCKLFKITKSCHHNMGSIKYLLEKIIPSSKKFNIQ